MKVSVAGISAALAVLAAGTPSFASTVTYNADGGFTATGGFHNLGGLWDMDDDWHPFLSGPQLGQGQTYYAVLTSNVRLDYAGAAHRFYKHYHEFLNGEYTGEGNDAEYVFPLAIVYENGARTAFFFEPFTTATDYIEQHPEYAPELRETEWSFQDNAFAWAGHFADELPSDATWTFTVSRLAPVPEPGTWGLFLSGFFGAGWALRRSRRHAFTICAASMEA